VRVVYHALGGGHGHVLRGLAVLGRLGGGTLVGPARLRPWADALGVRYTSPPDGAEAAWVAAQPPPDLLLADVFPRGVVGELAPWLGRVPAWLVTRRVVPDYYLRPVVRRALESGFERVLWTEEPPEALRALAVAQDRVPSVLLRVPALPRDDARRRLGVARDRPLILALGSGEPARQARLCRLLVAIAARAGAALRFVSDELPQAAPVARLFPAAAWLPAADVVVSAAGYHAFHETAAAGVPAVFVPQRRRYDDQWWRAREAVVAGDPAALETAIGRLLREGCRPRPVEDGAGAVARAVEGRVQPRVLREEQVAPVA
jgi:UDP:flavonoid glycosyltransferase YjiC (YdhE family)